jgi:hypothetical protein
MSYQLRQGDMREVLAELAFFGDLQVDSVVTDPPYHLQSIVKRFAKSGRTESTRTTPGPHQRTANGFMGKQWDGGDIAFRRETWELVYEIMKPGAYIIAFSGSRTYHRMAVALDDAGFIVHPMKGWIFGQGFPKAHNPKIEGMEGWRYGTQSCKPALEPIFFGQKPPDRKMRDNILHWGTGAINIDGCRVEAPERLTSGGSKTSSPLHMDRDAGVSRVTERAEAHTFGRWPANLIHDGSDEVLAAFHKPTAREPAGQSSNPDSAALTKSPRATGRADGKVTHDAATPAVRPGSSTAPRRRRPTAPGRSTPPSSRSPSCATCAGWSRLLAARCSTRSPVAGPRCKPPWTRGSRRSVSRGRTSTWPTFADAWGRHERPWQRVAQNDAR